MAEVAVVGAGLMGAALVRALADAGHHVQVWNRTPGRAERLADTRIRPMHNIQEAVAGVDLVVACTSSYQSVREALEPVTDWGEAALVNLTTGTPDEAESMQRWADERLVPYLDGALICFPEYIGRPDALIVYGGSRDVWVLHHDMLMTFGGGSRHLSDQVRSANVLDTAIIGSFYVTAVGAYVEAATYAHSEGVSEQMMRDATKLVLRTLGAATREAAAALESGQHATEQATLATYASGARRGLETFRSAGQSGRLLAAAVENLEAAIDAGLGDLGIYAQTRVLYERAHAD